MSHCLLPAQPPPTTTTQSRLVLVRSLALGVWRRYNVTRRHMDELCESLMTLGYQFILIDCPAGIDVRP